MQPRAARDLFMDLVRTGSLLAVVAGHWLGIVPTVRDGVIAGRMVYDVEPSFWPLTWAFQVLPLFFFVGGFANATSLRHLRAAGRKADFIPRRLARLVVPTFVFLGLWVVVEAAMTVLDVGGSGPLRGMRWGYMTPIAPLWFLGVYLVLIFLTPFTLRLHERFGFAVPVMLAVTVCGVDGIAFGLGRPHLLGFNIVLVWLLPHQLGYFYADGRLQGATQRSLLAAAGSLVVLVVVLTSLPWYSRNLLDNGVTIIGITAPTVPFVVMSLAMTATVLALRRPATRWLERPWPRVAVNRLTPLAMTLFLWHMTAYFAGVALMAAAGLPFPASPDALWWVERPLFLLLPGAALVLLAWIFGRFERTPELSRLLPVA